MGGTLCCYGKEKRERLTQLYNVNRFWNRRAWSLGFHAKSFTSEFRMSRLEYETWILDILALQTKDGDVIQDLALDYVTTSIRPQTFCGPFGPLVVNSVHHHATVF